MSEVGDVSQVDAALQSLMTRPDGPFVTRLVREAGRRDSRYAQLFCGPVADAASEAEPLARVRDDDEEDRLTRLERLVDQLVNEVSSLKARLGDWSNEVLPAHPLLDDRLDAWTGHYAFSGAPAMEANEDHY